MFERSLDILKAFVSIFKLSSDSQMPNVKISPTEQLTEQD